MNEPIRVVIVDDSALMRRMLTTVLEQDSAIRVVGAARDGREAIAMVSELRPDVVTMDVYMPVMDGLATTEHLMAYCPTPILVLTASLANREVDVTFKMLGAGALEVVEKPSGHDSAAFERTGRDLIRRIKVLSRVKVVTHLRGRRRTSEEELRPQPGSSSLPKQVVAQRLQREERAVRREDRVSAGTQRSPVANIRGPHVAPPPSTPLLAPHRSFPLIVIGASTGGPRVVYKILSELPRDLHAAVLVVQHIAEGFSPGMVEWLSSASLLPVALAEEGQQVRLGEVLVAPDQHDMLITRECTVHLTRSPLLIQRPSIDIAMQAAAETFGPRAIGVLLTGMGRDGAYGMLTIQRRNGYTIAQDEQSCTIFGMPRAAIQLDAANEILSPAQIAPRLIELVSLLNTNGSVQARRSSS